MLVKQLVQSTDVELVVLVYRLLVGSVNPGDRQGFTNYGKRQEANIKFQYMTLTNSNYPFPLEATY